MNVIDCVMIRDELEMARSPVPRARGLRRPHVVVESPFTHRGDPKPQYFGDALAAGRFAQWKDKISLRNAGDLPATSATVAPRARPAGRGTSPLSEQMNLPMTT